jgi:FkbH-like protein
MNEQRSRENAEKGWTGTFDDFLNTIEMKITFGFAKEEEIERITNLANRTNELNATRTRYTEDEIRNFIDMKNFEYEIPVVYLSDKFGDYGLIGEAILEYKEDAVFIKDICISCRTMNRGIGSKLLEFIIDYAKKQQLKHITGLVIKNEQNYRMSHLYTKQGFTKINTTGDIETYELLI